MFGQLDGRSLSNNSKLSETIVTHSKAITNLKLSVCKQLYEQAIASNNSIIVIRTLF